jgi:glycosyltransferase involved in cell wall biosynthesis
VPEILAATDILAHPSLEEGFSNAILEAMASSVPVVATNVGGNREAVRDGETGLLVEARRPDQLGAAIVALGRDPARARAMGAAGRTVASGSFSVETAVRRYEEVYTTVVGHGTIDDVATKISTG